MKTPRITTTPSASAAAPKATQDSRKSFSQVLHNRRGKEKPQREAQELEACEDKLSEVHGKTEEPLPPQQIVPRLSTPLAPTGDSVSTVSSTRSAGSNAPIQALAKEIWHSVNAKGQHQVDIHLNSKVFDGLKIQLVRDSDRLNIRFENASDSVAQLLNRNVGALTESLSAHGIRVGQIRVVESDAGRWMAHRPRTRSRSGGQGRRRQS